jgi:hypothetical protein
MPKTGPFDGVPELRNWVASGGIARAGLPAGSADDVLAALTIFMGVTKSLTDVLSDLETAWRAVSGDNSLKASIGTLLTLLEDAVAESKSGTQSAMGVKVAANKLYGRIDREVANHTNLIATLTDAIKTSEANVAATAKRMKEAKAKLNAGDMILHGLETIVTFGTTDRNRDNLETLKNGLATINVELVMQQTHRSLVKTHQNELIALRKGVSRVVDVDHSMGAFQSELLAISPVLLGAYKKVQTSESTRNVKAAKILLNQARPKMDALLTWIAAFKASQ